MTLGLGSCEVLELNLILFSGFSHLHELFLSLSLSLMKCFCICDHGSNYLSLLMFNAWSCYATFAGKVLPRVQYSKTKQPFNNGRCSSRSHWLRAWNASLFSVSALFPWRPLHQHFLILSPREQQQMRMFYGKTSTLSQR